LKQYHYVQRPSEQLLLFLWLVIVIETSRMSTS
jgi:hypothetical protein